MSGRTTHEAGLHLVECAVLILALGFLALFLFTPRITNHPGDPRLRCLHNLKHLGQLSMLYADDTGGHYPFAAGGSAHDSQNLLLEWDPEIDRGLFVCDHDSTTITANDGALLTPENTSYAWIGSATPTTAGSSVPLASDLPGNHERGRNVVYCGLRAEWVGNDELPASRLPEGLVGSR